MRTASDYQTPAVPYHTLICGSLSTPNTALVRKNAEYITNTRRCVELFVTLWLRPRKAYASAKHVKDCQRAGLHVFFYARTLSLVPSRNSDAREILLRSLFPEYADGPLIRSM